MSKLDAILNSAKGIYENGKEFVKQSKEVVKTEFTTPEDQLKKIRAIIKKVPSSDAVSMVKIREVLGIIKECDLQKLSPELVEPLTRISMVTGDNDLVVALDELYRRSNHSRTIFESIEELGERAKFLIMKTSGLSEDINKVLGK